MKTCTKCGHIENNDNVTFCQACGARLTDIAPDGVRSAPAQPRTGQFCMNCGSPFNEYGVCPKCGNTAQRQTPTGYATAAVSEYMNKPLDLLRKVFSKSCIEGAQLAGRETRSSIWPVFAGAFIVLNSLALAALMLSAALTVVSSYARYIDGLFSFANVGEMGSQFGSLFVKFLIMNAVLFFGSSALLTRPIAKAENKLSMVQLMNFNSYAFVPLTAASAATLLLCLLDARLGTVCGIVLLMTGVFAAIVISYVTLQKLARVSSSPFWTFMLVFGADVIIFMLSFYLIIKDLINNISLF